MIQDETNKNTPPSIRMGRKGKLSILEARMAIPLPTTTVFPFFADAGNLETITPPWLHFKILTPLPIEMRNGALIEYRLRLHGIPIRWLTEITAWDPPHRFVDVQKRGPYRTWIHEHTFADTESGCEMTDFVQYAPPGGRIVDLLFVRRSVRQIFEYRARKLSDVLCRLTV